MSARPFIGAMRYRMQIESPVATPDGFAGTQCSYNTLGTIYAQLRTYPNNRYAVLTRYRSDLTTEMRLRYNQRLFQVLSIDRIDRYTSFVRVTCEELRG
jgi:head-tail adaptor